MNWFCFNRLDLLFPASLFNSLFYQYKVLGKSIEFDMSHKGFLNCSSAMSLVHILQICRDFLRKVCRRGVRCKFLHINPNEDSDLNSSGDDVSNSDGNQQPAGCGTAVSATQGTTQLTFCHDYQNNHCTRPCCKSVLLLIYIHSIITLIT